MIYDSIIIGAGLSGGLAANYIHKTKKNIKIIEKENHIGGRCASKMIDGKIYNYGNLFLRDSHFALIQIIQSILPDFLEEIRIDYVNLIDKQYHIDSRSIFLPKTLRMDEIITMLTKDIACDFGVEVLKIVNKTDYFEIVTNKETYKTRDFVITCPGKTTKRLLTGLDIQIETEEMNAIFTIMANYQEDDDFDFPYYKFINHSLFKEILVNKRDHTIVIHVNDYIGTKVDLVRRELVLKTVHNEFIKYFNVDINIVDFYKWEFAKGRLVSDLKHVYDFSGKKVYLLGDWTSNEKNLNGVAESYNQFIREFKRSE
jgi:predicted NAD/FAD-dependent oxidoreductase